MQYLRMAAFHLHHHGTAAPWTHHGHPPPQVVDVVLVIIAHRIENPGIISGHGWLVPCWAGGYLGHGLPTAFEVEN